jgi:hypothetical protein
MPNMRSILILLTVFFCLGAWAAPANRPDEDVERFLSEEGITQKVIQLRQSVSDQANALVINAMGFLGVPYHRGGTNSTTGFDCSGFVRAMFEQSIGILLPHRARDQAQVTQNVSVEELKPGDLVFYNTMRSAFSHVGIYVGDGKFIHSPKTGESIRIEDMRQAYWARRFNGARRVTQLGKSPLDALSSLSTLPGLSEILKHQKEEGKTNAGNIPQINSPPLTSGPPGASAPSATPNNMTSFPVNSNSTPGSSSSNASQAPLSYSRP